MPCYYCKKGIIFGRRHIHHRGVAGGRWKKRAPKTQRIFRVNLQPVHIIVAGKSKRAKLCTRCIKRIKKDTADGKKPFLTIAKFEKKDKKINEKVQKQDSKIKKERKKK